MLLTTQKKRWFLRVSLISIFFVLCIFCVCSAYTEYENQKRLYDCEIKQSLYEYISQQENGFNSILQKYLEYYKNPQIKSAIRTMCKQLEDGKEDGNSQISEEALTEIYQLFSQEYSTNCIAMTIETKNGKRKTIGESQLTEYYNNIWSVYSDVNYVKYYENGHEYIDLKSSIRSQEGPEIIGYFYVTIEEIHTFEMVKENYTELPIRLAYIYNAETLDSKYKNPHYGELALEDKMTFLSKMIEHPGIIKRRCKVQRRDPVTHRISQGMGTLYMSCGGSSNYVYVVEIPQHQMMSKVRIHVFMNHIILYVSCILLILICGLRIFWLENQQNERDIYYGSTWFGIDQPKGLMAPGKSPQIGNRYQYYQDVETLIQKDRGTKITLLFLDLKQFELFKYTHELPMGELVLNKISEYLAKEYPKHAYRLGGDKFCITILGGEEEVDRVVHGINDYLEDGVAVNDTQIRFCGHYGVAVYPTDSVSAYELLQKADIANYYGKSKSESGGITFYNAVMSYELNWKSDLFKYVRKAQNLDMIQLISQNTYDLSSNQISYVKIWIKVKKPLGGEFNCDELMTMNDQIGMRGELLSNSIQKLCEYIKSQDAEGIHRNYGINFVMTQLTQESFLKSYLEELKRQGIDYHRIWFEVYETRQGQDYDKLLLNLIHMKELGIRVIYGSALSGNDSGIYLPDLPLYGFRLNRNLTRRWNGSAKEYEYAEGIIHAAKALQIQLIADGVDDEVIKEYVIQSGIDQARGSVFDPETEVVL